MRNTDATGRIQDAGCIFAGILGRIEDEQTHGRRRALQSTLRNEAALNSVLLFIGIVIIACILIKPIGAKLPFPTLLIFVALGMFFGVNGPLHIAFDNYELTEGACCVALMLIMFYGGFNTNLEKAKPVAPCAIVLSTVGVALTTALTGVFCHFALRMDWTLSMLLGATVASTDAASVFSVLREHKLSLRHGTDSLLELESGSNDPLSYILTIVFANLVAENPINVPLLLVQEIGLGIVFGVGLGWIAVKLFERFDEQLSESRIIAFIAVAIIAYALPIAFEGSGFLSVYLTGMVLGSSDLGGKKQVAHFFDVLTEMAEMVIFFLIGLLVTPAKLPQMLLPAAGLVAFMLFIGRPIAAGAIMLPFRAKLNQIALVSWAGLRGAASTVFILVAVVNYVPGAHDLFELVFTVAVLSIVVQGTLLPAVARKLDMIDTDANVMRTFNDYQEESDLSFIKLKAGEGHPFVGKTLAQIGAIESMLVALILRDGDHPVIPDGNTVIEAGDLLVLAAPTFEASQQVALREHRIGPHHRWCGLPLRDLPPERRRFVVVTLKREGQDIIPNGDTVICAGDTALVATLA